MKGIIILTLILILAVQDGFSWIFPEHRDIMILAIQKLDPVRRVEFERYWALARIGRESRLMAGKLEFTFTAPETSPTILSFR
jgi:hypothetical protein